VPAVPFRGIQPFRYVDHTIFFARREEAQHLASLVAVYRGVLLYGDSGAGKSSLVNAGLFPRVLEEGLQPERIRVQPRAGEEIVLERVAADEEGERLLPSTLAPADDSSPRVVFSTEQFFAAVRVASRTTRPLLVFDQFEEIVTLFEEAGAADLQRRLIDLLVGVLHGPLPVKILLVFREDYLARLKQLLGDCPELVDQALRLSPPSQDALRTIIRGPFERCPEHFEHELSPALAGDLRAALGERFGSGQVSLSEVQTVCLRLWQAERPELMLATRGVEGILEDHLGEALDAFPSDQRRAAVALLGHMVTPSGTRNVISAEDLLQRVRETEDIATAPLQAALRRLERESGLVRRERRRDLYLYEITSEFLVPWISARRDALRRAQERRRLLLLGGITVLGVVVAAIVGAVAIWALGQRDRAQRASRSVSSLALSSIAQSQLSNRLDVALLLGLDAYRTSARPEALGSLIASLDLSLRTGLIGLLHGHTDFVQSVAFTPNGRVLASGSSDGTVRLWDVARRRPIGHPLAQSAQVNAIAVSPDGRTVGSAGADGKIRLWSIATQRPEGRPLVGHGSQVTGLAFSRDGTTLASASYDGTLRLWDLTTPSRPSVTIRQRGPFNAITTIAFSPDGRLLATGAYDDAVRIWSVAARRELGAPLVGHGDSVRSVAFSPNGGTLASGSYDGTVRLWSVASRQALGSPLRAPHAAGVSSVAFSPDGRLLASGSYGTVGVWDLAARRLVGEGTGYGGEVNSVAFSPDGRSLASGGSDKLLRLWDVARLQRTGKPVASGPGVGEAVAFSPQGRLLATGGSDGTVRLYDVVTRRQDGGALAGHRAPVTSLAFTRDGSLLASGSGDGSARLWSVATHRQVGHALVDPQLVVQGAGVDSVTFSPDGRLAATGGADGAALLWSVATHEQVGRPLTHPLAPGFAFDVTSVAFRPDGRLLATGNADGTVRLWSVATQRQLRTLRGHTRYVSAVAFSPDGRVLASAGDDNTIRLWDVGRHREIGEPLAGSTAHVTRIAFSPDGRTLASSGGGAAVLLWDVKSHVQMGEFPVAGTAGVAFSPNGRMLAAGSGQALWLWDDLIWQTADEYEALVCQLVGTGLARREWQQYAPAIPYQSNCR
jgi:WD40 repeat protein